MSKSSSSPLFLLNDDLRLIISDYFCDSNAKLMVLEKNTIEFT